LAREENRASESRSDLRARLELMDATEEIPLYPDRRKRRP
jgi:hypothetical protein